MNQLLFYLIQVIAASGLLYGYYHFALRNKKFHHYNRFYLLMSVLISILIPFLNIPVYFSAQQSGSSVMLQTLHVISSPAYYDEESVSTSATWFTFQNVLYLFYSIILAVFLIRILFSLNKIRSLIRKNTSERLDKIRFVNTDEPGTPFSFFRWLFWNRKIELHSEKGEQIFRHELFHIQQKHSWDIIFVELVTVIFWINPFFHLIKRELKAIHEFLADEFAIKENNNWQYAELLLMQALNTNNHLVNPFFHNQIKRRIAMITTSTKPSYQYLRKLMVLPVAAIIIFLFAFRYQTSQKGHQGIENVGLESLISKSNADTTKPLDDRVKEYDKYLIVIDGVIQPQRGLRNIDSTLILKNGLGSTEVYFDKHGEKKYGEKGKDGVIEIITYDSTSSKPGVKKDKPEISDIEVQLTDTTKPKKVEPLIVINGTPMPNLKMADLDKIIPSPSDIESIAILKGDTAIKKYGDIGKNDAIEIKAKKFTPITQKNEKIREIRVDSEFAQDDDNKVFVKLEVEPSFPGGEREWRRYLEKNLDAGLPLKNGCKSGTYTVMIQFIVDQRGNISDVRPLTKFGYGMEDHVMSLIKKGPKWIPGIQNGRNVKAYKTQPVTFVIGNEKPDNSKSITNKPGEKTILNEVVVKSFENDESIVFEKVETEARFPGGVKGWREFLEKNLKSTVPVENGANKGTYTVVTQFIVHKDGSISDLKTLTNHGHGMEDEVLRVMKESPNWIPAMQNGCNVTAYRKQPVTFVIVDE